MLSRTHLLSDDITHLPIPAPFFPSSRVYFFLLLLWPPLCCSWFQGNDPALETLALLFAVSFFWTVVFLSHPAQKLPSYWSPGNQGPNFVLGPEWSSGRTERPCPQEGSSCAGGQSCTGNSGYGTHNIEKYVIRIEPGNQPRLLHSLGQERTWLTLKALDRGTT